jgi:hypothetical protein
METRIYYDGKLLCTIWHERSNTDVTTLTKTAKSKIIVVTSRRV